MKKRNASLSGTLRQEFQKDLELFKYFLLMLNNSSPVRNVELMWADELDPVKAEYKELVSTGSALVQLQLEGSAFSNRSSPSTLFCDHVHGFGAQVEQTCARSDGPAKKRCQSSGCTQVYGCYLGLTDIAVPVTCDGQYLGTLFSGQVLTEAPTAEGFARVKSTLFDQKHIDFDQLEAAYFNVAVVNQTQLAEMVRILELFARYIGNSWKRLEILGDFQRVRERELTLNRKEFAAMLLSGEVGDLHEVDALAAKIGLRRLPDRVLVLRIKQEGSGSEPRPQIADTIAMSRLFHTVEDLCQGWSNTLVIAAKPGELCIFTHQESRNSSHGQLSLREMGESILSAVKARGMAAAHIGVSASHLAAEDLLKAYHEACAALDGGGQPICFFENSLPVKAQPGHSLAPLVQAIRQGIIVDGAVREFLARAMPAKASATHMQQSRALLTWAVEHLAIEMISVGADARAVTARKEQHVAEMLSAPNPFSLCEVFRRFAGFLAQQVAWTFSQRESKIVTAVHRLVEERGAARMAIQEIADSLKMSSGHLSRLYSRTTGMTLEEYLIRQRVELAKRMLLDPRLNVAEVAERCGFCNPAYFASVFKKYAHCTPRGFASQPRMWQPFVPMESSGGLGPSVL